MHGAQQRCQQETSWRISIAKLLLSPQLESDDAREILGAMCSMTEDKTRVWHVKMPDLRQAALRMPDLVSPVLHWLDVKGRLI